MNVEEVIKEGNSLLVGRSGVRQSALIGSAAFMPGRAKDVDIAVLIASGMGPREFCKELPEGWLACSKDDGYPGEWFAVRKGDLNLMVTNDAAWFERYVQAMQVAAYLNLDDKWDRIAVCKIVRDGEGHQEVRRWVDMQKELLKLLPDPSEDDL